MASSEYQVLYIYTVTEDIFPLEKIKKEIKINFRLYKSLNFEFITKEFDSLNFDLIFIDFSNESSLSTINTFVEKVVQIFPKLPLVGLSDLSDLRIGIRCLELGFLDFFYKPNFDTLSLYKILSNKKHVKKTESSRKHYQQLFQLSPQPMFVYDIKTLIFLDVNNAAIKKYGFTKEEFLNMTLFDIRTEENKSQLLKVLADTKNNISRKYHGLSNHIDKKGNSLTVDIHSNLTNFDGRLARIVLANDVTTYLETVEAVKRQNDILRDISWLQSHKLRAPLVRIMALVSDCSQNNSIPHQFYLDEIQKASDELDEIIRTISNKAFEVTYSANEVSY